MEKKVKVAVVGASGYSGEELVRLLLKHPYVELTAITSRANAGKSIGEVYPRFAKSNLAFCNPEVAELAKLAEVAFLALPHGLATEYAIPLLKAGLKVIDISADFRLRSTVKYEEYYGAPHPSPELLKQAVYGQPERYREALKHADLIACAGCYPTSSILPSAPLLAHKLVSTGDIVICSASGVTGAGRKVAENYIFPECNESFKAYGIVGHRHVPEIEQELAAAAGVPEIKLNFIPHLAPFNRGINSTLLFHLMPGVTLDDVTRVYHEAYDDEPFVMVLPPKKCADTKYVTMTNMCQIGYNIDPRTNKLIVTSVIDNLTKGASGQAIQCMNIRLGLPETAGL